MIKNDHVGKWKFAELLGELRQGLVVIALLSAVVNLLTLAGSIYLMLVYDRVLPGQSLQTLLSLFIMVGVAYVFQGIFDVLRSRMLADVAFEFDRKTSTQAQKIESLLALTAHASKDRMSPTRDLDRIRSFIASPGVPALIDLPWIIFFMAVLTLVHYSLGLVTLAGTIILAALTWHAERINSRHVEAVTKISAYRQSLAERQWRHAEIISGLGMRRRMADQWARAHAEFLDLQLQLVGTTSTLMVVSKIFRMFLQSLVLTVGAMLVIDGKATAGIIFASSVLMGRALAPVDQAIANWRNFVAARQSWGRLEPLLSDTPDMTAKPTLLPPPCRTLSVERVALSPPGSDRAVIVDVSFTASAGQAIGIIGSSASGKSSLVRGIVGLWPPLRGIVRLDGAALSQWDSDTLGRHIGYLPQSVELFDGTIAENISRFDPNASSHSILAAGNAAGVHDMILRLSDGYDTRIGIDGINLSAGQRQRIALARALYLDPFLVVLDEPNSNLDPAGDSALVRAILGVTARGGIVILVAHHGAILNSVDHLLLLRDGKTQAFGPRNHILAEINRARKQAPEHRSRPVDSAEAVKPRGA